VGAVSGRLVIGGAESAAVRGVGMYWTLESRLRAAQADTGSVMGVTGAIYAVRRELYTAVPPNLILDDVFVPMQVILRGRRVGFRPEAVAFDSASAETNSEYRRKLRTMTGNIELLRTMPELLSPCKNPFFSRYLSHKVLRLASPVLLLVVLLTGVMLPLWPEGLIAGAVVAVLARWIARPVAADPPTRSARRLPDRTGGGGHGDGATRPRRRSALVVAAGRAVATGNRTQFSLK
jgi:hypothetical protein